MKTELPLSLIKPMLSLMPNRALAGIVPVVLGRVRNRHPKLFAALAKLPAATVVIDPLDIPHRFVLRLGQDPIIFDLLQDGQMVKEEARIAGNLEELVDMLEGRVDGDALFFSRGIQVTGDTAVIVGLRNTLDREEIDLFTEILSLCGPFAGAARVASSLADGVIRRVEERLSTVQQEMHKTSESMKNS